MDICDSRVAFVTEKEPLLGVTVQVSELSINSFTSKSPLV